MPTIHPPVWVPALETQDSDFPGPQTQAYPEPFHGVMEVIVVQAKQIKDVDVGSTSDPYVSVSWDDRSYRSTKVVENSDCPRWNTAFRYHVDKDYVPNGSGALNFRIMDHNFLSKVVAFLCPMLQSSTSPNNHHTRTHAHTRSRPLFPIFSPFFSWCCFLLGQIYWRGSNPRYSHTVKGG